MAWLLIQEIQRQDWVHRLTEGVLHVGRLPEADVCITHSSVSRQHATLTTTQSKSLVRDLGSRHGTWLNDRRVTEAAVQGGDRLRFGAIDAEVVIDLDEALRTLRDVGSTKTLAGADAVLRDHVSELTNAQRRVLRWLLRGLGAKQIAFELKLSRHTVCSHIKAIHSTLGIGTHPELMAKFWAMWEDL